MGESMFIDKFELVFEDGDRMEVKPMNFTDREIVFVYTSKKLPDIKNVEFFDSSQPTIKVTFDDNTSTTCTLQEGDFFNLKGGIAWCIAKKVTDGKIFAMANKGEKIYKNSLKEKDKEKALQEMIAHKKTETI